MENVNHTEKVFEKVHSKSIFCFNKIALVDTDGPKVNAIKIKIEESGNIFGVGGHKKLDTPAIAMCHLQ